MPVRARPPVFDLLARRDRRSLPVVAVAVTAINREPARVAELVSALMSLDPVVSLRAADALEKLAHRRTELLTPYREQFLRVGISTADPAVRWNLIQILVRLVSGQRAALSLARRLRAWYLSDASAIVRTGCLGGIVTLAASEPRLTAMAHELLDDAKHAPSAAVRARARRLAPGLTNPR